MVVGGGDGWCWTRVWASIRLSVCGGGGGRGRGSGSAGVCVCVCVCVCVGRGGVSPVIDFEVASDELIHCSSCALPYLCPCG